MKTMPFLAILLSVGVSTTAAPIVLSSNLSQLTQPGAITGLPDTVTSTNWRAARFGTDNNPYALNTVTLALEFNSFGVVSLYSDLAGSPGQALLALPGTGQNCPQQTTGALCQVAFNGSGFGLSPNSNYWIVFSGFGSGGSGAWFYTSFNQGDGPGFQPVWAQTSNSGTNWTVSLSSPMLMSVTADVPEPGTLPLLVAGAVFLLLGRTARRP